MNNNKHYCNLLKVTKRNYKYSSLVSRSIKKLHFMWGFFMCGDSGLNKPFMRVARIVFLELVWFINVSNGAKNSFELHKILTHFSRYSSSHTQIKKVLAKAKTFFMGRVVGLSWILLSLGQVICFTLLSQIFVLTYSSSARLNRLDSTLTQNPPNPQFVASHPHHTNKKDHNRSCSLFYGAGGGIRTHA